MYLIVLICVAYVSKSSALKCYQCEVSDLSKCTTMHDCKNSEVCRATVSPAIDGNSHYSLGCAPQTICDEPAFGKRALTANSTKCCNTNSCNKSLFPSTTMTTSTTTSTQPPSVGPISCVLCRGPKFICERAHRQGMCTLPEHVFCINDVENLTDGSRYVTRRCATKAMCERDWIVKSYNRNECKNYNVKELSDSHFSCSFCCKGNNCNLETLPAHLYYNESTSINFNLCIVLLV